MARLRNKPKSIAQFIIDLTPLLDVIFILLIVVLSAQRNNEQIEERYAEASEMLDEATEKEARYDAMSEQLNTYANLSDYVNVVTIYSSYSPSNLKYRTVFVSVNGSDLKEWNLNPSNESSVWNECKTYIEGELADNKEVPTIFGIKDEKMLYRDEQSILALYESIDLPEKYVKNYTETEDE